MVSPVRRLHPSGRPVPKRPRRVFCPIQSWWEGGRFRLFPNPDPAFHSGGGMVVLCGNPPGRTMGAPGAPYPPRRYRDLIVPWPSLCIAPRIIAETTVIHPPARYQAVEECQPGNALLKIGWDVVAALTYSFGSLKWVDLLEALPEIVYGFTYTCILGFSFFS